jgi:hypothetical protein
LRAEFDNTWCRCADILARSGRTVICSLWSIKNLIGDRDPCIQTSLRSVRRCSRPPQQRFRCVGRFHRRRKTHLTIGRDVAENCAQPEAACALRSRPPERASFGPFRRVGREHRRTLRSDVWMRGSRSPVKFLIDHKLQMTVRPWSIARHAENAHDDNNEVGNGSLLTARGGAFPPRAERTSKSRRPHVSGNRSCCRRTLDQR